MLKQMLLSSDSGCLNDGLLSLCLTGLFKQYPFRDIQLLGQLLWSIHT